ncbi:MAG: AAA family ATPase [Lewinellaceae bacterium]|nr:AAA family ATPase [Lewinellaceae bacterium]
MKKVIVMRGLPGSGKSTYAKKLLAENPNAWKRINRDELRAMFDGGHFSNGNEKFVKQVRDLLIIKALEDGKHVIVDDTNLAAGNATRILQLVQEFNKTHNDNVTVEVIEMDTPLEECIARDAKREKPVGAKVIGTMHRQFYTKNQRYAAQDPGLPRAVMCDLDGTLALLNGRSPYDSEGCEKDLLNEPVAHLLTTYRNLGHRVILVSGRKDTARQATERWLETHAIGCDLLLMRAADDNRKDSIVKSELFHLHIRDKFFIEFILDDRDQVVDMWRNELGLPCWQVYYGDF